MKCLMEAEEGEVETSQKLTRSLFTKVTSPFDLSHLFPERGSKLTMN